MSYFALLAVVLLVCFAVNRAKGRPVVNPGRVALIVLVIFFVVDFGIGIALIARATSLTPEAQGEIIGRIVGSALIPLAIAGLVARSFRKKHASQPTSS